MHTLLPLKHPHDRAILAMAIPAIGSLAIDPLVSLVDTIFVGHLGTAELAALGINSAIFAMAFIIFNFLAYATTPKIAEHLGRNRPEEASQVVAHALWLATFCGVLMTGLLLVAANPILDLMGAQGAVLKPAQTYLHIRAFAGPALLISTAAHGAFRGIQDTRTPLWVTALLNLINLVLDPLLIFGFGLGIAGAAAATVAAQWTGALIFVWLLVLRRRGPLHVPRIGPSIAGMLPLLRVGSALLLRTGALVGTMTLATAVAARQGTQAVAAHQVANQIWGFFALLIDALAIAGQALLAGFIGRGDIAQARALGNRLLQWGLACGLTLGIGIWLTGAWIAPIFTSDTELVALILTLIPFVALLQPLNAAVFVWDGLFMGTQAFRFLALAMLISTAVAASILAATHALGWGLFGVWSAITALMLVRAITLGLPWWLKRVPGLDTAP
ncbi:MATE family efflux transporter [Lujinxingia litoralis]|uniref:MATE family efflux transporter n=1 Tax=Lujinxingia litoralis TaxID=2211119 RepID=A0A328C0T4_9DELT|nr:MATE family efflux transporter [Lujinxingia litoralis]RAL20186.1 MATE family efflux transporter [Lujinxingia litoralis]